MKAIRHSMGALAGALAMTAMTAVTALTAPASALAADAYPSKPIKIVVPFTAGGVVDSVARIVGQKLSEKYGQPVIVENRAGAGGSIGTDYVAKSAPDGYTLLLASPSHTVAPTLMKGVTWNPVRDFRGVEGFGAMPNVIVVPLNSPAKTMGDFVSLAKKSQPPLTFASAGVGTSNHLSGELLAQIAGIKLTHVPYKGQPEALTDLLAGRVSMMPLTTAIAVPYIKQGKLKALAVTTAKRSSVLPDLPTVAEAANLPSYEVGSWTGLVAPAKTPDDVVNKLSKDVSDILAMPDTKAKLQMLGMDLAPESPKEFDAFVARDYAKWTKVIKQAGIEAQ